MREPTARWLCATLALFLLPASAVLHAQELDGYEYWFDHAFSSRTVVDENLGAPATLASTIPVDALSDGFHTLAVRFRRPGADTLPRWSAVSAYRFFKKTIDPANADSYEYWFDGERNGLVERSLDTSGSTLVIAGAEAVSALPDGFHTISLRVRSGSSWSAVSMYRFFKKTIDPAYAGSYEYWFDGNRSGLVEKPLDPSGNLLVITDEALLTALSNGLHTISLRVRSGSSWSAVSTYRFYKNTAMPGGGITAWEYWWDDDIAHKDSVILGTPAQDILFLNETLDMSQLCKGKHTLSLRFYGFNGWSAVVRDSFEKTIPRPGEEVAKFDIIADGGLTTFVNTSQNGTGFQWIFGDGATSTLPSPFHKYNIGVYDVKLVNFGSCGNDTASQKLIIPGVSGYTPKKGGKNGVVTMTLTGVGFAKGMDVRLKRSGQADVDAEEMVQDSARMTARFKFQNALPGKWDLIIKFAGGDSVVFKEGFTIEDSTYSKLSIKINSGWRMRSGTKNRLTVTVFNEGNADEPFVPVALTGFKKTTEIEPISDTLIIIDDIPVFDPDTISYPRDSLPYMFTDDEGKAFKTMVLTRVPAGGKEVLEFEITPAAEPTPTPVTVRATVGKSFLPEAVNGDDQVIDCFKAIVVEAINEVLMDQSALIQCIGQIALTMADIKNAASNQQSEKQTSAESAFDLTSVFFGILETGAVCAKAAGKNTPLIRLVSFLEKAIKAYSKAQLIGACSPVLGVSAEDFSTILIGNSFDPNIKTGPGNGSAGHYYATSSGPLVYFIQCENDTSALFAAQRVVIMDTLDMSKLDLSTFRFTHVNVAGYSIALNTAGTQFIRDIYLSNASVIARVSGRLDTISGVVTWVMNTVDPATGQITDDPEAGILQPNFNPPEGDASVGFAIHKRPGIPDDVLIENRAVIIFDTNDPILTNTWGVVSDNVLPLSQINTPSGMQDSVQVHLSWSGWDNLSGVQFYRVYVSDDGGPFFQWQSYATDTLGIFSGQAGHTYRFYSIAVDSAGNVEAPPAGFDAEITISLTNAAKEPTIGRYILWQNAPNPFGNSTRIDYTIPEFCPWLLLRVTDISGRSVQEFSFQQQPPGTYSVFVEASGIPAGLYFYQLLTPNMRLSKRMVVERF